jgi:hypothetical protein
MTLFWASALVAIKHQARAFSSCAAAPKSTTRVLSTSSSWVPKSRSIVSNNRLQHQHHQQQQQQQQMRLFSTSVDNIDEINEKIKAKGDEIRQLKADGSDKAALAPHIQELLALKAQLPPDENAKKPEPKPEKKKKEPQQQKQKAPPAKKDEDMDESELRMNRLSKVESMRTAGVEPFEYSFDVTRTSAQLISEYEGRLEGGEEDEESDVSVAGRIMTRRVFGKLAFFTLQDETGSIQLQFDKKRLGDTFKVGRVLWCTADHGLFVC